MDGLFPFATASEYQTSIEELEILYAKQLQSQLTGIFEIACPPNVQIFSLIVQGLVTNTYLVRPDLLQKIPPDEWASHLGETKARARIMTLPLEAIRIGKMLLECSKRQGTFQLPTRELVRRIDGWSTSPEVIAIQINWPGAEGVLVFPGKDAPVQPAMFLTHGQLVTESDAIIAMTHWKESTCTVSILSDDGSADVWKEYKLRLVFTKGAELLLTRYKEMAGQSLVSALNQAIDDETLERGWRISCVGNGMIDHHIFSSPQEAAEAYRVLSRMIQAHLDKVLGAKIAQSIVSEIFEGMDQESQGILRTYQLLIPPAATGISPGETK
jgi:hypothetical protein